MEMENNGKSTTMMTNTMKQNVFRMARQTYSIWDVGVIQSMLRKRWCLLMEWRNIQRVTETECVQSIEADIFRLRHWLIEVSSDTSNDCSMIYSVSVSTVLHDISVTYSVIYSMTSPWHLHDILLHILCVCILSLFYFITVVFPHCSIFHCS